MLQNATNSNIEYKMEKPKKTYKSKFLHAKVFENELNFIKKAADASRQTLTRLIVLSTISESEKILKEKLKK